MMRRFFGCLGALGIGAAVCFSGCRALQEARDAQVVLAPKGVGADSQTIQSAPRLVGYSLEQLVAFALTNRPSVVAARLAVKDARLALQELAAEAPLVSETPWTSPSLSLSGGHSESSAGTSWREHDFRTSGNAYAGLSLEILVWDFGRYDARAKAQAERVVAAECQLVEAGNQVFDEVSSAYFSFREKSALFEVACSNEMEYASHLRQVENRFEVGEADRLDVLRVKLDLAEARQSTVAASNQIVTAGAELMRALGIDASRGLARDVLGEPEEALWSAYQAFSRTTFDAGSAFAFARTNAPSLQVARARLRAASAQVDYARRDLGPSVSLSVGLRFADPLWMWNWGVGAVQSLFQGTRKVAALDRAVVALQSVATEVDLSEQSLSAAISLAVAERDNAIVAIKTAAALVAQARENLESVREEYEVGEANRIELSDSVSEYSAAIGTRISAFYRGQMAEAKLFALLGKYPVYKEERKVVK